ncbi:MAG: hypothetical protein J7L04_07435, partial [Bacteroidales bacterium]|nr:hypothetical protein [Bacteroidales bacterium]
ISNLFEPDYLIKLLNCFVIHIQVGYLLCITSWDCDKSSFHPTIPGNEGLSHVNSSKPPHRIRRAYFKKWSSTVNGK